MHSEFTFFRQQTRLHQGALFTAITLLLIDSVVTLTMPWFASRVAEQLLQHKAPGELLLAWFLMMAAHAALVVGSSVISGRTGSRVVAELGSRVYDHVQALPVQWHQSRKRGEVLALLHNDVWRVSGFLTTTLTPLIPLTFTCLGATVMLMSIHPWLGLFVASVVAVLALVLKVVTRQLRPLADATLREQGVKLGILQQNLSILPLIKEYTREADESSRFAEQGATVQDLEYRQLRLSSPLAPVVRLAGGACVLGLLWLGAEQISAGRLTSPQLISLLLYGLLLTQPLAQLAGIHGQTQAARGSVRRLMELLDESPEADAGIRVLERVRGEVAFESVAFAYPGRPPLLKALDLRINAGETVAITGVNGAGKSTLAHLLTRLIEPTSGRVTLDGVDLRELALKHLRSQVGVVSQNVVLLNASIARNIGYGIEPATRDQIEAAARSALAHDFISKLPQGYDTVTGDDGVRLSGGQKQRIALARALLKDPAVLILDEATAMFDPQGEKGFIAECHGLLRSRTVLLITHRPASLALADRVLVLEDGHLRNA